MERKCEKEAFMGLLMIMVKRAINGADETVYRGKIDQRLLCFKHAKEVQIGILFYNSCSSSVSIPYYFQTYTAINKKSNIGVYKNFQSD